jgi:hypothetical protein
MCSTDGVPSSPAAAGASPRRSLGVTVSLVWYSLNFAFGIFQKRINQPEQLCLIDITFCQLLKIKKLNDIKHRNLIIALTNSRLLLGEAPSAEGDEGTPRTLCSHLLYPKSKSINKIKYVGYVTPND